MRSAPTGNGSTRHYFRLTLDELKSTAAAYTKNGTTSEAGLFFIAYTKDLAIPEKMLCRMLGASGDGHHDHLMDYTQAVTGAHFFAPSLEMLASLANP